MRIVGHESQPPSSQRTVDREAPVQPQSAAQSALPPLSLFTVHSGSHCGMWMGDMGCPQSLPPKLVVQRATVPVGYATSHSCSEIHSSPHFGVHNTRSAETPTQLQSSGARAAMPGVHKPSFLERLHRYSNIQVDLSLSSSPRLLHLPHPAALLPRLLAVLLRKWRRCMASTSASTQRRLRSWAGPSQARRMR